MVTISMMSSLFYFLCILDVRHVEHKYVNIENYKPIYRLPLCHLHIGFYSKVTKMKVVVATAKVKRCVGKGLGYERQKREIAKAKGRYG